MGIDALRAAIEQEARNQVAATLDEARARAQLLRTEAEAVASERLRESLRGEEVALRRKATARIAEARNEADRSVLEARDALLDEIFELAGEQLSEALEAPNARRWIIELAEQALGHMPDGAVVIDCSSDLTELLAQALAEHREVQIEPDPALCSGFRVRTPDGALVVDAALANLLELRRAQLAIEVLRRLEEGTPA